MDGQFVAFANVDFVWSLRLDNGSNTLPGSEGHHFKAFVGFNVHNMIINMLPWSKKEYWWLKPVDELGTLIFFLNLAQGQCGDALRCLRRYFWLF